MGLVGTSPSHYHLTIRYRGRNGGAERSAQESSGESTAVSLSSRAVPLHPDSHRDRGSIRMVQMQDTTLFVSPVLMAARPADGAAETPIH